MVFSLPILDTDPGWDELPVVLFGGVELRFVRLGPYARSIPLDGRVKAPVDHAVGVPLIQVLVV